MIQFSDSSNSYADNAELDFTNSFYQNIILNGNANFRNSQNEDFIIGQDSNAINKATTSIFNLDILGVDRTINPDIGAYQHITFE